MLLGRDGDDLLGQDAHDLLHRQANGMSMARSRCSMMAAFIDGRVRQEERGFFVRGDGSLLTASWLVAPLRISPRETGALVVFHQHDPSGVSLPVSTIQAGLLPELERLALLAETTTQLTATLDVHEALDRLVRLVVPLLADWVVIDLVTETGDVQRNLVAQDDHGHITRRTDLQGTVFSVPETSPLPLSRALRGAGSTLATPHTYQGPPDSPGAVEQRRLFDRTGMHSAVIAPIRGLREVLGAQLEAMEAVANGRDTLVVMPTVAGKSAVYQVAALCLPGPTAVVSPLLALQRDQIAGLLRHDAPEGVAVNSDQGRRETAAAWEAVGNGDVEYPFLSPEQLEKDDAVERLARAAPSLFVVDEAQCVSTWGHDFRPAYLRLAQVVERVGRPTVLALTATAAPPVRDEIVERLGMRDTAVVAAGFDRPLEVRRFQEEGDKRRAVVERAAAEPKPGIVYAGTRKDTEGYAVELAELGLRAAAYHAGLPAGARAGA